MAKRGPAPRAGAADRTDTRRNETALDARLRRQHQIERICWTPRLVFELIAEIERRYGLPDLDERIERYPRVDRDILRWLGGDQFAPAPIHLVAGGRR